jgi:hypothetical protein
MVLVKITAKIPPKRPQIAEFQNAPKQFLETALKRAGAGQSFKANSDFLCFQINQNAHTPPCGRAVNLDSTPTPFYHRATGIEIEKNPNTYSPLFYF